MPFNGETDFLINIAIHHGYMPGMCPLLRNVFVDNISVQCIHPGNQTSVSYISSGIRPICVSVIKASGLNYSTSGGFPVNMFRVRANYVYR